MESGEVDAHDPVSTMPAGMEYRDGARESETFDNWWLYTSVPSPRLYDSYSGEQLDGRTYFLDSQPVQQINAHVCFQLDALPTAVILRHDA